MVISSAVLRLLVGVAESEHENVFRADERTAAFEIGEELRSVTGREGQIH